MSEPIKEQLVSALLNECETSLDETDIENVVKVVLPLFEEQVTVAQAATYQGVTLWLGDSIPVQVDDDMSDLRGYIFEPIQRAVTIARLRTIADLLEDGEQE